MEKMIFTPMLAWRERVALLAATAPTTNGLGTAVCTGAVGDLRVSTIAAKRERTTGKRAGDRSAGSPAWSLSNLVS